MRNYLFTFVNSETYEGYVDRGAVTYPVFVVAGPRHEPDAEWLLSDRQLDTIRKNTSKIADGLDPDDELINMLLTRNVLLQRQTDAITELSLKCCRTIKLLDMLKRSSDKSFKQYLLCVWETQSHLLPYFTGDEGQYASAELLLMNS